MRRTVPADEDLRAWAQSLETENDRIRLTIDDLSKQLAEGEERLALIQRLLVMSEPRPPSHDAVSAGDSVANKPSGHESRSSEKLEDAVEEILRAAGSPMHISEIRTQLIERGVAIPGRGDDANIIVKISSLGDRFSRTARGTYALAEWGLPALQRKQSKARRNK